MTLKHTYSYSSNSIINDAIDDLCKVPPEEFAKMMVNEIDQMTGVIPMRVVIAEGVEREVIDGVLRMSEEELAIVKSAVTEELDNEILNSIRKTENIELKKRNKELIELLMNVEFVGL